MLIEEKTYPKMITWFKDFDKKVMFPIFRSNYVAVEDDKSYTLLN